MNLAIGVVLDIVELCATSLVELSRDGAAWGVRKIDVAVLEETEATHARGVVSEAAAAPLGAVLFVAGAVSGRGPVRDELVAYADLSSSAAELSRLRLTGVGSGPCIEFGGLVLKGIPDLGSHEFVQVSCVCFDCKC